MYIKIKKGTSLWTSLFTILSEEEQRSENYIKWQRENLPEFDDKVLQQRHSYCLYPYAVAWKFKGNVDAKVWKPVKGYPEYYKPNKRTKVGKEMQAKINEACGKMFNRIRFFDIFKTNIPRYGSAFTMPTGFISKGEIYMLFDEGNYKDIMDNFGTMVEELTRGQWEKVLEEDNE